MLTFRTPATAARLWVNEPRPAQWDLTSSEYQSLPLKAGEGTLSEPMSVAIEGFIRVPGQSKFGVLGLTFRPADSPISARLPIAVPTSFRYPSSDLPQSDEAFVGLPEEYRETITMAFRAASAAQAVPATGEFIVDCGATAVGATSEKFIGGLARALLCVTSLQRAPTETEWRQILIFIA